MLCGVVEALSAPRSSLEKGFPPRSIRSLPMGHFVHPQWPSIAFAVTLPRMRCLH